MPMPFLMRCSACQQYYVIPHTMACMQATCSCGRPTVLNSQPTSQEQDEPAVADECIANKHAETRSGGPSNRLLVALHILIGCCSVVAIFITLALAAQLELGWLAWGLGALFGLGLGQISDFRFQISEIRKLKFKP